MKLKSIYNKIYYIMNTNKVNGVIYYKLDEKYNGDITKNCGLSGEEIDSNFFFLRGFDIEEINFNNENKQLIFNRVNGETIIIEGIETPISLNETYYDKSNGTLVLNINGVVHNVSGFYVKEDIKFHTGISINGDGSINNPIDVSETLKTGLFAPVHSFIDLTNDENSLPDNVEYGTRFLTKENINKCGLLYNAEGLLKVQEILKNENSPWRVPSDREWGQMLNALEESPENRNHINQFSNKNGGVLAGPLMKKGSYKWVEIERTQVLDGNTIQISVLPTPSFVEYYECNYEDKTYVILNNNTYFYYKCENVWKDGGNNVTPIYEIPQHCDFKVLPVGRTINGKHLFYGEESIFWSSTEEKNTDIWTRIFNYNTDIVSHQANSRNEYFSIRLVRDYDDVLNSVEYINGLPYETILMPYVEVDENGNIIEEGKKIWTSYNISFTSLLDETNKYSVRPQCENEDSIVYFINYWNGKEWEKQSIENNSMIAINNGPDSSKNEIWQIIGNDLVKLIKIVHDYEGGSKNSVVSQYALKSVVNDINERIDNIVIGDGEVNLENYYTKEQVDELIDNVEVDLTGYATEQWIEEQGYLTSIPSEYVTESELTAKNYATKSEIPTIPTNVSSFTNDAGYITNTALDSYATKTYINDTYQVKGDYLTSVPDEYVTDTELTNKGYATESYVSNNYQVKGDYLTSVPDEYVKKSELEELNSNLEELKVKITELISKINSLEENYISKTEAENKYISKINVNENDMVLSRVGSEVTLSLLSIDDISLKDAKEIENN